jgi:hypothetical protein
MGTTPIYALRYPAATDPADVPTDMQELATDVETLVARSGDVSYGTTLPAGPVNGQQAILVDSTTNPSYQWRFRYNSGSSSTYKWEFIGGLPARVSDTTSANPSASGWTGPYGTAFTVPRNGGYYVTFATQLQATPAVLAGVSLWYISGGLEGGAATLATVAAGAYFPFDRSNFPVSLTSGTQIAFALYTSVANPGPFTPREMSVIPTRVS